MQVSVQTLSGLERQIDVAVPAERIETEIQNRLNSLSRRAKVAGFRPGKVPMHVIKQHYGSQVRQEVVSEVLETSFYEAVAKEKLRPAGMPHIHPKVVQSGGALEYSATFEVYPEVKLNPLSGVEVEKPKAEISEQDVDKVIETIRQQRMEWIVTERASKTGDRVRVDFKGTRNGEEFAGGSGKDMPVEIGKGRMIPGFEEKLVGLKASDSTEFELTFPSDYHHAELANQVVRFEIKIIAVEEPKLPEVNEDFVKAIGVEEGTVDALRQSVRKNMQREMDDRILAVIKSNVMDALLKQNPMDVPKSLVHNEVHALLGHKDHDHSHGEIDAKVEELAKRRVGLGLLLAEVVKQQNLKVDPRKLREAVEHIAASYEKPDEVIQYYYSDKKRLGEVESFVLENEVVNWVVANATVKEVTSSFDALIKTGNA